MPIWLRAAPNPIFVSATRASQTWVTRRRRRRGRLKIPTTRSAHSLATLSPKREAMAFDFEPKTLDLSPMFNPDPETLNSNKAKRSQDTPRPMLLDSQVQSHCHENMKRSLPFQINLDEAATPPNLRPSCPTSIDFPELACHATSAPSSRPAASPRHS